MARVKRLPLVLILLVSVAILVLFRELRKRRLYDSSGVDMVDVREDVERLISERTGGPPVAGDGTRLTRIPLDEETAKTFFPALRKEGRTRDVYDPQTYFRNRADYRSERKFRLHPDGGWTVRFNHAGFKSERELAETPPDLRVLVAGDSHSEGVVPIPENYCSQLEVLYLASDPERSVEALNASRGGYMLYNYLGVLEKYAELEPDVFVMAIFGGNDFAETVPLYAYFEGLSLDDRREKWGLKIAYARRAGPGSGQALAQGMHQEALFHYSPEWRALALAASLQITTEVAVQCAERDIEFVLLYIPPATDVQQQYCADGIADVLEVFEMTPEDRGWTERIADEYLDTLRAAGVHVVDLRPAYRATEERLYWKADLHINTRAHRIAAEELHRSIESFLVK